MNSIRKTHRRRSSSSQAWAVRHYWHRNAMTSNYSKRGNLCGGHFSQTIPRRYPLSPNITG